MKLTILLITAAALVGASPSAASGPRLSLVKSKSFCATDAYNAYLYVYVTVQNTGTRAGALRVRPWRRYSDASVNDSVVDEFTINVGAHKTKKLYGKYGYKATEHDLRQCGVYLGKSLSVIPLTIVDLNA